MNYGFHRSNHLTSNSSLKRNRWRRRALQFICLCLPVDLLCLRPTILVRRDQASNPSRTVATLRAWRRAFNPPYRPCQSIRRLLKAGWFNFNNTVLLEFLESRRYHRKRINVFLFFRYSVGLRCHIHGDYRWLAFKRPLFTAGEIFTWR